MHRPFQRAPGIQAVAARAVDANGDTALLQDILLELRGIRGDEAQFNPRASLSDTGDHIVGTINLDTALTNERVPVPIGQVLTILSFPGSLTTLKIRIGSRDAPEIDLLIAGNQIRKTNAFNEIFITTAPNVSGGKLSLMAGQAEVVTTDRRRLSDAAAAAAVCALGAESGDVSSVDASAAVAVATMYSAAQVRTTGPSSNDMFEDVVPNQCWQLDFVVSVLKPSTAGNIGRFQVLVRRPIGSATLDVLADVTVPESGSTVLNYRSRILKYNESVDITFKVNTLGPASNKFRFSGQLIVFPP